MIKAFVSKNFIVFIVAILCLNFTPFCAHAQEGVISYGFKYHGKEVREDHPLLMTFKDGIAVLQSEHKKGYEFIDYNKKAVYKSLHLDGKNFITKTSFDSLAEATLLPDTATISGYLCHKAQLVIRSNHIEVWYTDELAIKGTPDIEIAPYLGVVLKVIRNGNYEIFAKNID